MSRQGEEQRESTKQAAHRVRLPGFVSDEEIGLGDVVKRVTRAAGVQPCGGCGRRAEALNRLIVFSPRQR